jgi:hypothetical protein
LTSTKAANTSRNKKRRIITYGITTTPKFNR